MDTQRLVDSNFKDYVVRISASSVPGSITGYAVGSLLRTLDKFGISTLDSESLKLWIASMLLEGTSVSTAKKYTGRIHTLFDEWRNSDSPSPFADINKAFEERYQPEEEVVNRNLEMLKHLLAKNETSDGSQIRDIFFYLLYDAGATLQDIPEATFGNAPRYCAQIDEIVKRCDSSRGRKYLFSLNQSKARRPQILRELSSGLDSLMKSAGMKIAKGYPREEITAMWIAAALKSGVDIRVIRSLIPSVPYRYRALLMVRKTEIPEDRKEEIICRVADSINDNTPRWFVMKLRQGVRFDDIRIKIENELPGRLNAMELYYPTRTVTKKVGKKIHKEEIPYVADLLFFRTQYNKLQSLFAKIGDAAWCFKTSNLPGSRYSVISHEEMSNFQRCVGQFTSDINIGLSSIGRTLGVGRMVRITGGVMKGYKGKIVDIDDGKGTRRFFLRVSNENALNWTAEVEDIYIEPLNP